MIILDLLPSSMRVPGGLCVPKFSWNCFLCVFVPHKDFTMFSCSPTYKFPTISGFVLVLLLQNGNPCQETLFFNVTTLSLACVAVALFY